MMSLDQIRPPLLSGHGTRTERRSALICAILLLAMALMLGHICLSSPLEHDDCQICQIVHLGGIAPASVLMVLPGLLLCVLPPFHSIRVRHVGSCSQQRAPPLSL